MTGREGQSIEIGRNRAAALAVAALAILLMPAALGAQEMGETIHKQGKISKNLLLGGRTVLLEADIDGDVTAMGQDITVRREVSGDVNVTGATVQAEGHIRGDLRAFAGSITITGQVDGDVNSIGGSTQIDRRAAIGGDASLAGHDVEVAGRIAGNLNASARRIVIKGTVDGDVHAEGSTIRVGPTAVIKGKFIYESDNDAEIDPKAKIGDLTFMHSDETAHSIKQMFAVAGGAGVAFFIGIMILAAFVIFVAPQVTLSAASDIRYDFWRSAIVGLAVIVGVPILTVVIGGTFVGIPVAIALVVAYGLLLGVGYVVSALAMGRFALDLAGRNWDRTITGRVGATEVGLIVLLILAFVPVAGAIINALAIWVGAGTVSLYFYRLRQPPAPAA